jgi:meiotically up-regulated gene 157 (Mug157) protein
MDAATFRHKWREEELEEVHEELDDSWRHGNYVYAVYKDPETGKFWAINYQVDGTGDYNSLRDGDADAPTEVFPHVKTVVVTEYLTTPSEAG